MRGVHRITRYSLPGFGNQTQSLPPGARVAHVDVDAFYAQVEQEDFNLRGVPVIVGAWQEASGRARGIVATASYEARSFGIRTGMTHHEALSRCPYLVALRINYEKYRSISSTLFALLRQQCVEVEAYSMDEFYALLPPSDCHTTRQPETFARTLMKRIRKDLGLTVSIGIAHNKTYAKLGSALRKPAGLSVLTEATVISATVHPLSLDAICGVGLKRAAQLRSIGINTIGDAVKRGKVPFQSIFGPHLGWVLWEAVTGRERSPLRLHDPVPREFHHIHTLQQSTGEAEALKGELMLSINQVCRRLRFHQLAARKWEVYLRFESVCWEGVPIPFTLPELSCCDHIVFKACWHHLQPMLQRFEMLGQRFLGVGITALDPQSPNQQLLHLDTSPDPVAWFQAMDRCNLQTGERQVMPATLLDASQERLHFLEI